MREDIREETEGFEVQYTFTVVDVANDCAPLAGALRGQMTDENGQCAITSIWPGHYISRAVHVHMRVHTDVTLTDDSYTGGEVIHTGQLGSGVSDGYRATITVGVDSV